jgi:hypothetical protein
LADILTALILIIDVVLSVWNSYTAGFTYEMARKSGGSAWLYISAFLGLALGLAGTIYVTAVVVSFVAYWFGFIDASATNLLLGYNFLITGGLLLVLGIVATVQSIYIAVKRPGVWTVAGALYNTFASIWNVFVYIENFGPAVSLVNYERQNDSKNDLGTVIIIAILATLLSVLLSYFAFCAGRNHANGAPIGRIRRRRYSQE